MIAVFIPEERIQNLVMLSVVDGLRAMGEEVVMCSMDDFSITPNVQAGVMFGISNPSNRLIKNQIEDNGGRVLVVDYGAISRPHYWTIGWDGLMGRADFMNADSPSDRWNNMGIDILPWRKDGRHIVVACQVPWDGTVRDVNILEWAINTVDFLRMETDREIRFRPHPLAIYKTPSIKGSVRSLIPYEEDLKNAWAVVTWNSTSASMSVIKGIPIFAMDEGSIAWPIANHNLDNIEVPAMPSREQWAYDLAYSQWTMEEIKTGLPWLQLRSGV